MMEASDVDGTLTIRSDHEICTFLEMMLDEGIRYHRDWCFTLRVIMRETDVDADITIATQASKREGRVYFFSKGDCHSASAEELFEVTEWFYFVLVGPG